MNDLQVTALNAMADEAHANAREKGFHDDIETKPPIDRVAAYVANLHGEVSEFWEAARKGKLFKQCDKPIPLTCAEEELADTVLRSMDTARALKIDLGRAIRIKHEYNRTRPRMHNKLA